MPAILTPALALRHLRELSTDVRAAVALAPDGALVAGDAAIEAPARALLEALRDKDATAVDTRHGAVVLARGPAVVLVVVTGPHALVGLLQHDVRTLLADMHDRADAGSMPVPPALHGAAIPSDDSGFEDDRAFPATAAAAVEALIRAAQRDLDP